MGEIQCRSVPEEGAHSHRLQSSPRGTGQDALPAFGRTVTKSRFSCSSPRRRTYPTRAQGARWCEPLRPALPYASLARVLLFHFLNSKQFGVEVVPEQHSPRNETELLWEDTALDVNMLTTRKHHPSRISPSALCLTSVVNRNYDITNWIFDSHYGF